MQVNTTSLAYDLDAYKQPAPPQPKKPPIKVVQQRSSKRSLAAAFTPQALGSFLLVISLVCLMVYNQICLYEVTGEINEVENLIYELRSDNIKISSELESLASLRAVEDRAREELGMNRLDTYQTEYVRLYEGDTINITEHAPDSSSKTGAGNLIRNLMEYIGKR